MIGSGLKKLATANGMKVAKGLAYGNYSGFAATMFEGTGYKTVVFVTKIIDLEKKEKFMQAIGAVNLDKEYRVQKIGMDGNRIYVIFHDNPGTMAKIKAFLSWFIPLLQDAQATAYDVCIECGCQITDGRWVLINGIAHYMHDSCAERTKQDLAEQDEQRKEADNGSYVSGTVGALLGAVIGAVVWAIVLNLGYVAGIVGFLIGWLAIKGYDLLRGKQTKIKLVILAFAVIVGVVLGTAGGYILSIMEVNSIGVAESLEWLLYILNEPDVMGAVVKDVLLGLFFAALGVWALFRKTGNEVGSTKMVEL